MTGNGLKPPQFFHFKISQKLRSLEAIKVLAEMGCSWPADKAMAKFFFVNLAQTCDEQTLKISGRYLDVYKNESKITDFFVLVLPT